MSGFCNATERVTAVVRGGASNAAARATSHHDKFGQEHLRVLTYNVYYLSMLSAIPQCKANVCMENIADAINRASPRYDFVTLQEASLFQEHERRCPVLARMSGYATRVEDEQVV